MTKDAAWFRAYRASRTNTPHGTVNGYVNYGCRCSECRAAQTQQRRQDRAR